MHHDHIESISVPYKLSLFPKPLVPPVIRMSSEIPGNSIGRCVTQTVNITEPPGTQALNWPHLGSKPSLVTTEHDIKQLSEPP